MEWLVIAGAICCAAPVAFGLIVAKWDRFWNRSARSGPLV